MNKILSPIGVANRKSLSDLSASCFSPEVRGIYQGIHFLGKGK